MPGLLKKKKKLLRKESQDNRKLARPRRRTSDSGGDYNYREDGNIAGGIPNDDLCFSKDAQLTVVRPRWKGDFPLVFKALPAIDPDDLHTLLAARKSSEDNDYTDWMRSLPGLKYVGIDRQISCITYDPRWKRSRGYNPHENPYNVLYSSIYDAVENNGEAILGGRNVFTGKWNIALKKKMCSTKNKLTFIQGAIFINNDKNYVLGGKAPLGLGADDLPVVVEMQSISSIKSLIKSLCARPEKRADSNDILGSFVHGDPTSLTDGSYFCVYNPKKHTDRLAMLNGQQKLSASDDDEEVEYDDDISDDDSSREGDDKKFQGWEATLFKDLYYHKKDGKRVKAKPDLTPFADTIRERHLWFDDILHIPETEELCLMLAQAFKSMPKMLQYGWSEHPEFLTADVKAVFKARTTGQGVDVPADEDDEDEDIEAVSDRKKRKAKSIPDADDDDDGFEDDDEEEAPRTLKKKKKKLRKPVDEEEEVDDDEDADEEVDEDEAEEDEDDDGFEDDDEEDEEDNSSNKATAAAKNRASKRHAVDYDDEDADEEDEDMATGKKTAKKPSKKSSKKAAGSKKK